MNIGDYVRFDGEIAKIRDIKRYKTKEDIYVFDRILDLSEDRACNDNTIYNSQWQYFDNVKSSPNIIDLIEVGDYVNGRKVYQIGYNFQDDLVLKMSVNKDGTINNYEDFIYEKDIKSIVTKESMESVTYYVK